MKINDVNVGTRLKNSTKKWKSFFRENNFVKEQSISRFEAYWINEVSFSQSAYLSVKVDRDFIRNTLCAKAL